jgi:quercetin dioxygenase-like cupin family protein
MSQLRFSSADFPRVPSTLIAELPERLLHAGVLAGSAEDAAFSKERNHLVRTVDLPSRALSMTVGGLNPGRATRMHRHNYETIIYVISGSGFSSIESRKIHWKAGDAFYVPTWAWHQHTNSSETTTATYLACENAPMLQNLGIALREEA